MKTEAHQVLGIFLLRQLPNGVKRQHKKAFLLGCIQPDKNPTTYIKGSVHHKVLGGHNWCNAKKYIQKLCRQLESQECWTIFDYYKLGKLVHYIADGFTLVHNCIGNSGIKHHRKYEQAQHKYFLLNMLHFTGDLQTPHGDLYSYIALKHRQYLADTRGPSTDQSYIMSVCSVTVKKLISGKREILREFSPIRAINTCKI